LDMRVLQELGVPRNGDSYICGPATFMLELTAGLAAWGIAASRIRTEIFGPRPPIAPGVAVTPRAPPLLPTGPPGEGPLIYGRSTTFRRTPALPHYGCRGRCGAEAFLPRATNRPERGTTRSIPQRNSITSSARAISEGATVRASSPAVLRLIVS
jgi:hypothetical protein